MNNLAIPNPPTGPPEAVQAWCITWDLWPILFRCGLPVRHPPPVPLKGPVPGPGQLTTERGNRIFGGISDRALGVVAT